MAKPHSYSAMSGQRNAIPRGWIILGLVLASWCIAVALGVSMAWLVQAVMSLPIGGQP